MIKNNFIVYTQIGLFDKKVIWIKRLFRNWTDKHNCLSCKKGEGMLRQGSVSNESIQHCLRVQEQT